MVVATSLNIILSITFIILLLPFGEVYAVLGVTFATLISRYYNFFALAFFSRKLLKIKLNYNYFLKPLIASAIMAVFLAVFNNLASGNLSLMLLVIEIMLATVIYFFALFFFKGITKRDMDFIKNLIR